MALDATIGGTASNSYVTLTEANAYFANRAHASAWEDVDEPDKALMTATSVIDWYVSWKGVRVNGTQALDWPRSEVYDKTGVYYSEDIIPADVKTAVFEMALVSISADRTVDGDLDGLAEVRAASLLLRVDTGIQNTAPETIPEKIWKILGGLTTRGSGSVIWLKRA